MGRDTRDDDGGEFGGGDGDRRFDLPGIPVQATIPRGHEAIIKVELPMPIFARIHAMSVYAGSEFVLFSRISFRNMYEQLLDGAVPGSLFGYHSHTSGAFLSSIPQLPPGSISRFDVRNIDTEHESIHFAMFLLGHFKCLNVLTSTWLREFPLPVIDVTFRKIDGT